MSNDGFNQQNIICHCSGTTQEKIKTLIENDITDLDGISRRTGVCSGCGACENLILKLIADCGV
jgi:bacterioferritin-associated ferredoxin